MKKAVTACDYVHSPKKVTSVFPFPEVNAKKSAKKAILKKMCLTKY